MKYEDKHDFIFEKKKILKTNSRVQTQPNKNGLI